MWWCAEALLVALGQDPELARTAAIYCRIQIVAMPAFVGLTVLTKFLASQGTVRPPAFVALVSLPVHAATSYVRCLLLNPMPTANSPPPFCRLF